MMKRNRLSDQFERIVEKYTTASRNKMDEEKIYTCHRDLQPKDKVSCNSYQTHHSTRKRLLSILNQLWLIISQFRTSLFSYTRSPMLVARAVMLWLKRLWLPESWRSRNLWCLPTGVNDWWLFDYPVRVHWPLKRFYMCVKYVCMQCMWVLVFSPFFRSCLLFRWFRNNAGMIYLPVPFRFTMNSAPSKLYDVVKSLGMWKRYYT